MYNNRCYQSSHGLLATSYVGVRILVARKPSAPRPLTFLKLKLPALSSGVSSSVVSVHHPSARRCAVMFRSDVHCGLSVVPATYPPCGSRVRSRQGRWSLLRQWYPPGQDRAISMTWLLTRFAQKVGAQNHPWQFDSVVSFRSEVALRGRCSVARWPPRAKRNSSAEGRPYAPVTMTVSPTRRDCESRGPPGRGCQG